MMDRKEYAERFYSRHGRYPCWINYKVEDTKMMIDEQENQYDAQGNSTDYARCDEAMRLLKKKEKCFKAIAALCGTGCDYEIFSDVWDKWQDAHNAYAQHVRDCPECLAVKGRFAEEVE
jgi:hypothetical protein